MSDVGHRSTKSYFIDHLHNAGYVSGKSRILDMGAGSSNSWGDFFTKFPEVCYTAIEPNATALGEAKKSFGHLPNKNFINDFGYDAVEGFGSFDVSISLSALEHIKQLDVFLRKSVEAVRPGGYVIHWYDLGHALYPSSRKEWLQILLGNHLPWLLGERNFVRYVALSEVCQELEICGAEVERVYNLQSPAIKACLKVHHGSEEYKRIHSLATWELENQDIIQHIERVRREQLFPSIVVFARKR